MNNKIHKVIRKHTDLNNDTNIYEIKTSNYYGIKF